MTIKVNIILSVLQIFNCLVSKGQAGNLDNSFGNNGIVITTISTGNDQILASKIQSDGRILAAGHVYNGTNYDFAIARYKVDGKLDTSFNLNGKVTFGVGIENDFVYSMVIQNDGKILIGGQSISSSKGYFALARVNLNGSLDNSFGNNGKVVTSLSGKKDLAYAIAIKDDKIILAGYSTINNGNSIAIARYNINGEIDTTFNRTGKLIKKITIDSLNEIQSIAIQPNGKIVIAGFSGSSTVSKFLIARYNEQGTLDTGFAKKGYTLTDFGNSYNRISSVAILNDGKILACGTVSSLFGYEFALVKYKYNGMLDTTFGNKGKATSEINGFNIATSMALQPDGKIILAGYSQINSTIQFCMIRFDSVGFVDTNFGKKGFSSTAIGSKMDIANSICLQSNGRIIVAGGSNNGIKNDFAIVRYLGGETSSIQNLKIPKCLVNIYPNPSTGIINFDCDENMNIRIYNSIGSLVKEINCSGIQTLDMSNQSAGLYTIKIKTSSRQIIQKVFIIEE